MTINHFNVLDRRIFVDAFLDNFEVEWFGWLRNDSVDFVVQEVDSGFAKGFPGGRRRK